MELSDRFEGAARQQPSQHAECVERLACAHARTDGDRHPVLRRGLFERGGDDSLLDAGGDDQHPFAVAKDEVARRVRIPSISIAERKSMTLPRGPWSCA